MPEVLEPSAFCSEHARKGSKQTETVTVVDVKVAKARPGWLLLCGHRGAPELRQVIIELWNGLGRKGP